jgi:hypothetical protein
MLSHETKDGIYYNMIVALSRLAETKSEAESTETELGLKIASNSRPCNRFEIILTGLYAILSRRQSWHLTTHNKKW